MAKDSGSNASGGVGFTGLLTVLFVGLKLTHYIDWSWWRVTAPLWIPAGAFRAFRAFAVVCLVIAGVVALLQ